MSTGNFIWEDMKENLQFAGKIMSLLKGKKQSKNYIALTCPVQKLIILKK